MHVHLQLWFLMVTSWYLVIVENSSVCAISLDAIACCTCCNKKWAACAQVAHEPGCRFNRMLMYVKSQSQRAPICMGSFKLEWVIAVTTADLLEPQVNI